MLFHMVLSFAIDSVLKVELIYGQWLREYGSQRFEVELAPDIADFHINAEVSMWVVQEKIKGEWWQVVCTFLMWQCSQK